LALKWSDVDWLEGKLRVERGIVRQQVGEVKTIYSGRLMTIDPEMLEVLKAWKQTSQFAGDEDGIFAHPSNSVRCLGLTPGFGLFFRRQPRLPRSVS
jgi:integrase